ncbi:CHAT domain-containing protein [Rivularia sp. UHCC 0363]|uniref:CHAT domain-containing protein n=1 Tax=Rivularia sp. UHCC 0363 TaxID=3110244 RepID=UPI002B1F0A46|nr:CHAT domain-containing protein [Rivularia sp. UHCC 0363]MEA5593192.1 CHAT domain-containing protein [Rivularia sp. UHCC 0363]
MNKAVLINFGSGDLNTGFPRVTVQLWVSGYSRPQQFVGSLPAAPMLAELYRHWQSIYTHICSRSISAKEFRKAPEAESVDDDEIEIETEGITNISQVNFDEVCQNLQQNLNAWLNTPNFSSIEARARSQLDRESEIQVTLETNDDLLRRLPWHCWQFFADYPASELALSQPEYIRQVQKQQETEKVRILAVLGSTKGIDLTTEQNFLENLNQARTKFLVNPSQSELNQELLNPEGWEILFFAGHSQTEGETGRIYINENRTNNSLTIEQLQASLKTAIANGLKLAIFNSCDGLGLANTLEKLHIPTIIIMREPVPNRVAQEFFKYFLGAFAVSHLSLYLSVRQAREQLLVIEDDFPGASWLPAICQNPAVEPPNWLNIAKPVRLVLSSEQIYALESILLDLIGPIAPTLVKNISTQVSNFDDLVERLFTRLSVTQKIEFQRQIDLLLAQPEALEDENKIIDREFIRICEQILAEIIGPIAPILIEEALNLDRQSKTAFVETLASEIADPLLRLEFQQRISNLAAD